MTGKGMPSSNSLICIPNDTDIDNFIMSREYKSQRGDYVLKALESTDPVHIVKGYEISKSQIIERKHPSNIKIKNLLSEYKTIRSIPSDVTYNSDILTKELTIKVEGTTDREIIGFSTTGGFSYNLTKGCGKGFISVKAFERILRIKKNKQLSENLVLVRHKNSRMYYYATFCLI